MILSWIYHSGHLCGVYKDCVQSISLSTGQWEALPPPSILRSDAATLCVVDGRLFIIGGGTASVEKYVALERQWVFVPDMPRAVFGAAVVALDGKLLVIGGFFVDGSVHRPNFFAVLEYDPGDDSWKELPSPLTARSFCTVTVLGGNVVVMDMGLVVA